MKTKNQVKPNLPKQINTWKLLPSETILPDDFPINWDFIYICDNVITMSNYRTTVGDWKRQDGIKEIRRCDIVKRANEARIGDRVE